MQRRNYAASFLLVALIIGAAPHAQAATYHLGKDASTVNTSFDKLLTAGPDATSVALTTTLTNKAAGEYLIKEFETQTGVPNTAGTASKTVVKTMNQRCA